MCAANAFRIGIDLGGTKIEGVLLDSDRRSDDGGRLVSGPIRCPTPQGDYGATLVAIAGLVARLEAAAGLSPPHQATVGIGMPGSIVEALGLVQNANSTWLNGRPFNNDVSAALGRPVRLQNDANCFALSEAIDGAGAGARSIFGVILGTGCGGGLVYGGRLIDGPLGIAGEWGHNPLPSPDPSEQPGPQCWCGRRGCIEAWVSGPALEAQYREVTGEARPVADIATLATEGNEAAIATLSAHTERLAHGLAQVINIFDPEVVVLGGGLSNLDHLYRDLPTAVSRHIFAVHPHVDIRRPRWGASGGVRGAAWLWD